MCGIAGFFNNPGATEKAVKALETIKNRGMDGAGFFDGKNVFTAARIEDLQTKKNTSNNCIGHCLHSVVGDVKQPIKGKGMLAANCEIYNWRELGKKHRIKAVNDAELLLKMLDKGKDLKKTLKELNGVFAFAYWNREKVVLARDTLGEKPLWYSVEKGLAFASEKKALEKQGMQKVRELNPRKILVYDAKKNKTQFLGQSFFALKNETKKPLHEIKNELQDILLESVKARAPGKKPGILFSGGIDSCLLALACKKLKLDFSCYVGAIQDVNGRKSKDLLFARRAAREIGVKLKVNSIPLNRVESYLEKIVPLIEDSNVVKVGVALPLFLACEKARKDGVKVIFSGLGADGLFAGFSRFQHTAPVNKDCLSSLRKMYERDTYRDDVVCMANNIELRLPYLDKRLVEYSLKIPGKYKLDEDRKKIVLRELAKQMGLNEALAEGKKVAAQYGSNADWAIGKLAKLKGFGKKSAYLKTFREKPNLRLAALVSGGKDSLLAMEVMREQNYEISCLITMKSRNKHSFMFHTPAIDIVKLQARAMGIPLIEQETTGQKETELKDLEKAVEKAVKAYNIEGIVSGALYSNYQRERIEKVADKTGIKVFSPLWHKKQEEELQELLDRKYIFVMTGTAVKELSTEWLGREISRDRVLQLRKIADRNGMNVSGEGGEYETLVIDCPMFREKIKLVETETASNGQDNSFLLVKKAVLEKKH